MYEGSGGTLDQNKKNHTEGYATSICVSIMGVLCEWLNGLFNL